jgi:hypothetical protein
VNVKKNPKMVNMETSSDMRSKNNTRTKKAKPMKEILVSAAGDLNSNKIPNIRHKPNKTSPKINPLFFNLPMRLHFERPELVSHLHILNLLCPKPKISGPEPGRRVDAEQRPNI